MHFCMTALIRVSVLTAMVFSYDLQERRNTLHVLGTLRMLSYELQTCVYTPYGVDTQMIFNNDLNLRPYDLNVSDTPVM